MNAATSVTPRTRIEEAKARFTIPVLWRMFNLRGDPGSPCRSPFREDRSPSFSVFDDGRRWIDHATAERGDAIDFLAKIKGISNAEAFIELLKRVDGIAHQYSPRNTPKLRAVREPITPIHQLAQAERELMLSASITLRKQPELAIKVRENLPLQAVEQTAIEGDLVSVMN